MPFLPSAAQLPLTIRAARSLLILEGALLLLAAIFILVVAAVVPGSGTAIGPTVVSGGAAAALAIVDAGLGAAALFLARQVGQLRTWSRESIVITQLAIAVWYGVRSAGVDPAVVVGIAMCVAIVVLLFTPSARLAYSGSAITKPDRGDDLLARHRR